MQNSELYCPQKKSIRFYCIFLYHLQQIGMKSGFSNWVMQKYKDMNKNESNKLFLSYQLNNPPNQACLSLLSKKMIPNFCIYLYSLHQIEIKTTTVKAFWGVFGDLINIPCYNNNWKATSNMSHYPVKFWTIFYT